MHRKTLDIARTDEQGRLVCPTCSTPTDRQWLPGREPRSWCARCNIWVTSPSNPKRTWRPGQR